MRSTAPCSDRANLVTQPRQVRVALEPVEQAALGIIDGRDIWEELGVACPDHARREAVDQALDQYDVLCRGGDKGDDGPPYRVAVKGGQDDLLRLCGRIGMERLPQRYAQEISCGR